MAGGAKAGHPQNDKKRKWGSAKMHHGSHKKHGMGRKDYLRQDRDKRAETDGRDPKKRRSDDPEQERNRNKKPSTLPKAFPEDEVAAEQRQPKHKVAVMIGYSGTGYRGMQINEAERTIEGDLFQAFVSAGAISKANATDPKKSQLVRCARTDKGVHAAGNVISLKLIIEDPGMVEKMNSHLSPQIRVWGIIRTIGSFSSYQACDSRWYEYLIPTHGFLPPHPGSWLAKRLIELADEAGDQEGFEERQKEVNDFWAETEEEYIKPALDGFPMDIRERVREALYEEDASNEGTKAEMEELVDQGNPKVSQTPMHNAEIRAQGEGETKSHVHREESLPKSDSAVGLTVDDLPRVREATPALNEDTSKNQPPTAVRSGNGASAPVNTELKSLAQEKRASDSPKSLAAAIKNLRQAILAAKKAYRISPSRLERIQPILDAFLGTRNFHNYTIQKSFRDPSAKRHIKSFKAAPEPIVINGTEWLSLKIHGQSFMMHQIRKMVAMIVLVIRCGCNPTRIKDTFNNINANIPKAPALGLLLERPVFDSYNSGRAEQFGREKISFEKYEKEFDEFKRREIYERIFREEEELNAFHGFLGHIDNNKDSNYFYLSSMGFEAVTKYKKKVERGGNGEKKQQENVDSEEEDAAGRDEGEG